MSNTGQGHQYITGAYRVGRGPGQRINPATGQVDGSIDYAGERDVEDAVAADAAAFTTWPRLTPGARSDHLLAFATELASRSGQLAIPETAQTGKSTRMSTQFDVPGTIDNVNFFAGAARHLQGQAAGDYAGNSTSMIRREAIGVIGSIAPWNYPLQMAAWKILPAIAAGNIIVLKPCELTPGQDRRLRHRCRAPGGMRSIGPARTRHR